MTEHPLTDKMCLELSGFPLDEMSEDWAEWQREDMRAAADWQLEKCDDDLGNILHCLALDGKITEEERIQIYVLFKEAMRPTNATNWRPTK